MAERTITEEEIISEVLTLMARRGLQPDEITVDMFMEKSSVGRRAAYLQLEKYIDAGLLKMRKVYHDGHEMNAYSPAIDGGWAAVLATLKRE